MSDTASPSTATPVLIPWKRPILAFAITGRVEAAPAISAQDFKLRHLGPVEGLHPNSILYCIDWNSERALFTPLDDIKAAYEASFLYLAQFLHARELFAVPLERLTEYMGFPTPAPRLVFSIGRCGSTLLSQLLNSVAVESVSEPDVFRQLLALSREWRDQYRLLVDQIVQVCMAAVAAHSRQSLVIKLRSQCSTMVDEIMGALPGTQAIYMFRERRSWMQSYYRAFGHDPRLIAQVLRGHVLAYDWLCLHRPGTGIIWYEELNRDPLPVLQGLGLVRHDLADEQMARFASARTVDSQEGTSLSRSDLKERVCTDEVVKVFEEEWVRIRPQELIKLHGLDPLW